MKKSTVEEIRKRFDDDVERFSRLESGQESTVDARLVMDLVTAAAAACNPRAERLLDIGCGAGNYTLKMRERLPGLGVTLVDLSLPMLERARQRLGATGAGAVSILQGDIREIDIEEGAYDIILAAAVLHHLRDDGDWEAVFRKLHRSLAPGGHLWVADLVAHDMPAVEEKIRKRYGEYLRALKGEEYRDTVFSWIEKEDTPRSLYYQLALMKRVGFRAVEVLHKNLCYAAFGGAR